MNAPGGRLWKVGPSMWVPTSLGYLSMSVSSTYNDNGSIILSEYAQALPSASDLICILYYIHTTSGSSGNGGIQYSLAGVCDSLPVWIGSPLILHCHRYATRLCSVCVRTGVGVSILKGPTGQIFSSR